jgi:HSP20 family protein
MAEAGKEVTVKKGEIQKAPGRMLSPFEGFDRVFDEFLGRGLMRPFRRDWLAFPEFEMTMPKVDVIDRDEEVVVRAEVPSVKKEDIEISISGNMVTIKGETKKEEKEEKGDYYRSEISRGSFSRMVSLPADVDESKAKAALKDGVLELTLPKLEKAKRRTIKVD